MSLLYVMITFPKGVSSSTFTSRNALRTSLLSSISSSATSSSKYPFSYSRIRLDSSVSTVLVFLGMSESIKTYPVVTPANAKNKIIEITVQGSQSMKKSPFKLVLVSITMLLIICALINKYKYE